MYDDDYYEYDEDESAQYFKALNAKIDNFSEDESEREALLNELKQTRYNPSNNPQNDAELVYRRAKSQLKQKDKSTTGNPHIKSYLKYMQNAEGISETEAKKRLRKALKED